MVKKSLDPPELVMFTHGKNTNFPAWKESMRNEIAMLYGDLVNIIELNEVLLPTEVDEEEFNLDDDPHGVQLHKEALTSRQRLITDQETNLPKCRALMWKYLSRESMEAVLRHEDYDEEEHRNDPLQLYLSVRATHPVGGGALDYVSRRSQARQTYRSTRQGPMESIAEYKTRFTFNRIRPSRECGTTGNGRGHGFLQRSRQRTVRKIQGGHGERPSEGNPRLSRSQLDVPSCEQLRRCEV
jgi:hypothetical protein